MSTGAIVAIVIAVVIVIALLFVLNRRARERRLDARRDEAHQIRREAEVGSAQADQTRAEADERAARARREEAAAREQVALADTRQREAQERHTEADRIDPDVEEREALERDERDQDAARLCQALPHEAGVAAIPLSAFSARPEGALRSIVRFAFCKREEVLDEAIERLRKWKCG